MKRLLIAFILILSAFLSFAQKSAGRKNEDIHHASAPFKIIIFDTDYLRFSTRLYILTRDSIKVIFRSHLAGVKDELLFQNEIKYGQGLKSALLLGMDALKEIYLNQCIISDSWIKVDICKEDTIKSIYLYDYYRPEIAAVIEFVNSIIPHDFKIGYDKKELMEEMKKCREEMKNDSSSK